MTPKRLIQPLIGTAVLAVVTLGGSAAAGAATRAGDSPASATEAVASSGPGPAPPTGLDARLVPATSAAYDGRPYDPYLTDHERYVRHHARLASAA